MMSLSKDTEHMQNNLAGVMIKKISYMSETWQLILWPYSNYQRDALNIIYS